MGELLEETVIKLPTEPDEFGVSLIPTNLRKLDFSALDFNTLQRATIEYIRTYFRQEFNDFVAQNGIIMLIEVFSFVANNLSQRGDILVDESFLPTSKTRTAADQHLQLINQRIQRATPAVADIEASVIAPVTTEIRIPARTAFTLTAEDGLSLTYELFRAPNDFTSFISVPPGKRGVIGHAIEGVFGEPVVTTSVGGPNQFLDITGTDVLDEPFIVKVGEENSAVQFRRIDIIEKAGPTDQVFEVEHLDDRSRIKFGDDVNGASPITGQAINVEYRRGGGIRGRIGANTINESRPIIPEAPASAAIEVTFRNLTHSSGGTDEETLDEAKRRAPRSFATQGNAVSGEDYAQLASTFRHPVFGSVVKAAAVVRTGIEGDITQVVTDIRNAATVEEGEEILLNNFVNKNIVELFVLAEGPDGPVTPSAGLNEGLITFFSEINVLTDEVRILDGAIKAVDVEATIIVSRNADAGTVQADVISAINDFFNIDNFDMGEGLNLSNLYEVIQEIPGVKSVNIFQPSDNILPTGQIASSTSPGVGFNELIVLGSIEVDFFFERGTFTR